jgi:cytochrome P450
MTSIELIRELKSAPYIEDMTQLTSFAECDEVLRSRDFIQGSHQESAPFVGDSLISLDGDEHFERRRLEAALFRRAALEEYETTMLAPHIRSVIETAAADHRGEDGVVRTDLTQMLRAMLARITAAIAGIDGVDTVASTERFISYVEELNKGVTIEWQTGDHDELMGRLLAVRDQFVAEFFTPSVERRRALIEQLNRGELSKEQLPTDLLTLLFLHWNDDWDTEFVLRESTLFYVAATQTTTHSAPHVVRHLEAWVAEHPEDAPRLMDPVFLKQAAYESLRLHVPVHALLRVATQDVTLTTGRIVRRGERVACCFGPANRDTAIFGEDASQFDPHRDNASVKPWGLSFGGGPHTCIGRALATGLSARTDGADATEGTLGRILHELYLAGVEIDTSEDQPSYVTTAHVDAYDRFNVTFTNL